MPSPLVLLAAALIGAGGASTDSLMGPGVALPLARARAATLADVRYDLRLDVTARDSAVGHVRISFDHSGGRDLVVDFRGRSLGEVRVNGRGLPRGGYEYNGAHLRLPAATLRAGPNDVELSFVAAIAPAGASVIRYHDTSDDSDYLYTLLVPADANQLFPCFDQPDLKARVTLTLTTPARWTAVANGALDSVATAGDGRTFHFAETRPLSTYLVAFAAGPWATVTDTVNGRPITMYVRRSRAAEAEADSLISLNGRALDWMTEYFGIEYPFGKYDFVLAPAFPFGGMEHPGAVFYNEDRFIFRERATRPQRIGRAATIYHEVAHQWFGDLVTMRWFDDLWLKEGFATYMAARAQDALEPSADAWKTFYLRNKPVAYGVDASAGTTPVWQELANLDQAKSNYGPIVYNKAPSVLKQLDYLVGADRFRAGVQRFLREHAYGNATWRDLLRAIADGDALDEWGGQFILRPGMPVVEQRLELTGDGIARLTLVQRPARPLSGRGPWPMKLELLLAYEDGSTRRIRMELGGDTTVVTAAAGLPAPAYVFANAGDYGYALVLLDDRSTRWLERHVGGVEDDFLRAMLWGALWDGVREARTDPARFLAAVERALPAERDEQIVGGLLARMVRASTAYLPDSAAEAHRPTLETLLWAGATDTSRLYDVRKAHLDAFVDVAAGAPALARLSDALDADSVAGLPLRAPTRWAIVTRLLETAAPTAMARLAAEQRRDTTSDGRRRAFVAAAAPPDAAVKAAYFARYLRDSTLNEDWATSSLGAFNSQRQQALTLPYLEPALDALPWIQENRRIFFLGAWLGGFLGGQTSAAALDTVRQWLAAHSELAPDLRAKILQASDELERTVRIRAAARAAQ
ncbi:MAG: M1 family metallopeptidase [Gemmatimonadaceae bacterium]